MVASKTARFSTDVTPEGTHTTTRGRGDHGYLRSRAFSMKYRSITSVTSKSAITPSLSGRSAMIEPGVRPIMRFASAPTAKTRLSLLSIATTEGSLMTMPWPRTATSVFAVPKSIARSPPYSPKSESKIDMVSNHLSDGLCIRFFPNSVSSVTLSRSACTGRLRSSQLS